MGWIRIIQKHIEDIKNNEEKIINKHGKIKNNIQKEGGNEHE